MLRTSPNYVLDNIELRKPPFSLSEQPGIMDDGRLRAYCSPKDDFSVKELNDVHRWLWIAGSLQNISALHHQKVLLREVIPCERARLHLVWFGRIIYIKPLPDYLLCNSFYDNSVCKDHHLHALLTGFLRSYCALIQYPVDLAIAKELHLISDEVTWNAWQTCRSAILKKNKTAYINKRYIYGELRLNRLDYIWLFSFRGLTYFTVHRAYATYFNQYFGLLVTVFAFVAVILTAMQVVVGVSSTPELLIIVSYRFSVAILVGICACFSYIGILFVLMFVFNVSVAWRASQTNKECGELVLV